MIEVFVLAYCAYLWPVSYLDLVQRLERLDGEHQGVAAAVRALPRAADAGRLGDPCTLAGITGLGHLGYL